jgi:plastocyanin
MSKRNITSNLRIIPRDTDFLDRRVGARGEIYFDQANNTLRLFDGANLGGTSLAKSDLSNVSNPDFIAKANSAGIGSGSGGNSEINIAADDSTIRTVASGNVIKFVGGDGIATASSADDELIITNTNNGFSTVSVDGQSDISAGQLDDTINFVAGTNVAITTDPTTNSITINSTAAGQASNSFSTISVATQTDVVAGSSSDILILAAGAGISIATNPSTDTITITNTFSSLSFDQLSDATTASLDIDQIYLPAITMLTVTNSGASAYRFDQYGTENNPTVYAINGTTIAFKLAASGHPFLIQTGAGNNYNTGLVHVATNGTVSTGAAAQGKDSGTLYWKIPTDISGGYRYQCSIHAPMVGSITIKVFATI